MARITREEAQRILEAGGTVYWCSRIPAPPDWDYRKQYDCYLSEPCEHYNPWATWGCRHLSYVGSTVVRGNFLHGTETRETWSPRHSLAETGA